MSRIAACFLFLLALGACESASSGDIKTSGIYAGISGTGTGAGSTTVSATLRLGELSGTFVKLATGDTLTAKSGSDSAHTLSKSEFLGIVSYGTSLTGDEEGKSITVSLNRAAGDVSAPSSVVTLPAKFQLTGPASGTTFARGRDAITVRWDNSGKSDPMLVALDGSCVSAISHSGVSDTGSLVIGSTELVAIKDSETKTCDVTITVSRSLRGTLDTAYGKGGDVQGIQSRTVSVLSGP